jgi:hypothetical protein
VSDSDDFATYSLDDEALDRALQALPRSQLPARDLWPELQAQLPPRRARRAAWTWAAAAVVAALTLSIWLGPDIGRGTVTATPVAQIDAARPEDNLIILYESQKATQLAALNFTSPAVSRQLAIWDGAVQQVRGALSYYPEEPRLLLQLDRLYRQQLNYLETLAMLDPQVAALYL